MDFYASQVIAFYDPEPRRFFVVRGAEKALKESAKDGAGDEEDIEGIAGMADMAGMSEKLIFAHELTHALQDETLRLDRRMKDLKDNGDKALALESLLEGEATLVMVRVVLAGVPGADESAEEMLGPLLSAGALERSGVPKDIPDYFVDQLFFPYTEGTAYVRRVVKKNGWSGVDRLWKNPPLSSSEILHEGTTFVPAENLLPGNAERLSPSGFHFLYADTLGEWTLRFLLRRSLDANEADAAAAGWRGDRIVFFASGRTIAYLWRARFDSAASAERFEAAWTKARARSPRKETVGAPGSRCRRGRRIPEAPRPAWLQDRRSGGVGSRQALRAVGAALAAARLCWMRRVVETGISPMSTPSGRPSSRSPLRHREHEAALTHRSQGERDQDEHLDRVEDAVGDDAGKDVAVERERRREDRRDDEDPDEHQRLSVGPVSRGEHQRRGEGAHARLEKGAEEELLDDHRGQHDQDPDGQRLGDQPDDRRRDLAHRREGFPCRRSTYQSPITIRRATIVRSHPAKPMRKPAPRSAAGRALVSFRNSGRERRPDST